MTDRNDISYNKAYNIINSHKKEYENNSNRNNYGKYNLENNNIKIIDKNGRKSPMGISNNISNCQIQNGNLINKNTLQSGRNTPKYSSNILNKNDNLVNNNFKLLNNGNPTIINNENNLNENLNNKGSNISIKFINNNINHFIISNQDGYNNNNPNNIQNNINNQKEIPTKKKKINSFRNVAKPQTSSSNTYNNLINKDKIENKNNKQNINNNIRLPDNIDLYLNKTPNSTNNRNLENIMVNHSQPLQPGVFNKYNIKQLNMNNKNQFSPLNRGSRGSLNLHSTMNKNSGLLYNENKFDNQTSRPASANNSKPNNIVTGKDKNSNSFKDNYNNPSLIASIKRNPSSNSLVKSLTRNYSKPNVNNDKKQNSNSIMNINKQTPKNYIENNEKERNQENLRNSYNNVNVIGLEKSKSGNKLYNSNNLNVNSPTINR